jgi:hypothetical protein
VGERCVARPWRLSDLLTSLIYSQQQGCTKCALLHCFPGLCVACPKYGTLETCDHRSNLHATISHRHYCCNCGDTKGAALRQLLLWFDRSILSRLFAIGGSYSHMLLGVYELSKHSSWHMVNMQCAVHARSPWSKEEWQHSCTNKSCR